jgi:hypothetical protein
MGFYVRSWHIADNSVAPAFVRFWTKADILLILAGGGLSAKGPKRTLAVRRSKYAAPVKC